jgi:UDP-N-acetylglucosamine 1-carboxyvinyltransferase
MAYLYELEKMGAHIEILNAHQALIIGPTPLVGRTVASNDIRAGVAMVLAALAAQGETIITDVQYIERGYDHLDKKLTELGASIIREEELSTENAAQIHRTIEHVKTTAKGKRRKGE